MAPNEVHQHLLHHQQRRLALLPLLPPARPLSEHLSSPGASLSSLALGVQRNRTGCRLLRGSPCHHHRAGDDDGRDSTRPCPSTGTSEQHQWPWLLRAAPSSFSLFLRPTNYLLQRVQQREMIRYSRPPRARSAATVAAPPSALLRAPSSAATRGEANGRAGEARLAAATRGRQTTQRRDDGGERSTGQRQREGDGETERRAEGEAWMLLEFW